MRRRFNRDERKVLKHISGGKCARCGKPLGRVWHADHVQPYSKKGLTIIKNGQALCVECNLAKGDKVETMRAWDKPLRRWQNEALGQILNQIAAKAQNFTLVAFPGAGKTTLALRVAHDWIMREPPQGKRPFVIVIVPSKHLKRQFETDAAAVGIDLTKTYDSKEGGFRKDAQGLVITYAHLNYAADTLAEKCRDYAMLVIMDECHHIAGENLRGETKAWGDAVLTAFSPAAFRLMMSGTLWRSDSHAIPFVEYDKSNVSRVEHPYGYSYGYKEALRDTYDAGMDTSQMVVRELTFITVGGEADFYYDMEEYHVRINEALEKELVAPAKLAILDPEIKKWFIDAFTQAHQCLMDIVASENDPYPDAAGLVIASSEYHATEYAGIIEGITGEKPYVVHYKGDEPTERIEEFAAWRAQQGGKMPRWIVSINMISEGVDIPRLTVLLYATRVSEKLYFYQAVGRVVRWDKKGPHLQMGYVYMPSLRPMTDYAEDIKKEILHVLHLPGSPGPGPEQKLWAALDNQAAPGPIFTTIGDKRYDASISAYAAHLLENDTYKRYGLTQMQLVVMLEDGVIPMPTVSQELPISRPRTPDDEANRLKEVFADGQKAVRRFLFKEDSDGRFVTPAINAYFKNERGYGTRGKWSIEELRKAIAEMAQWISEKVIPMALEKRYQYYKNGRPHDRK